MFILKISEKEVNSSAGDIVEFRDDGWLAINMYDGHTKLNEDEAEDLGQALIKWARRNR